MSGVLKIRYHVSSWCPLSLADGSGSEIIFNRAAVEPEATVVPSDGGGRNGSNEATRSTD
jgi:hypothetical protein